MVQSRLTVSTLALSAALLLAVPAASSAKEKAAITLQPKTDWTATMIEGASPMEGYCALARQYDQGLILTLGQSARDEYSLAIDFQDQILNTEKPYKITLQPGPGEIRAYEMMPASSKAMVVRLGYDEGFLRSLQKSNQLKIEIDGKNYQFVMNNLTKGRTELKTCMAGLKGESITKTAANFTAEKIENSEFEASPTPVVKTQAVKVAPEEVKKALAIPVPKKVEVEKKELDVVPGAIKTPPPVIRPAKEPVVEKDKKPIEIARIDSKSITPAPKMPAVKAPKVQAVVAPEPVVPKAKETVPKKPLLVESDIPKMEDKKLSHNTRVSAPLEAEQKMGLRPDFVAAKDKKYGTVSNLIKKTAPTPKAMPQPIAEPVKVAAVKEKIVEEEAFPKPFSKPASKKKDVVSEDNKPRVPEETIVKNKVDLETEKELLKVQDQLKELEKENHQLYQEAKKARGEIDTAVAKTSNQALKEMRSYEKKLEAANADNLALSKEIEELRRVQEDAQLSDLSGDPAAQKSLRRYNEAQREIKRLGLLLEQQRLSHRQEKVELENMLFDPAVTDQAQRQKLTDLEKKLLAAEKRLQAESQNAGKVDAVTQKKLQDLEAKLVAAKKKEKELLAEEEKVNAEAKKVAAAEVKLAALSQKEHFLKVKERKLLAEAKKLSTAETTLAQAQIKEQEIKAAEAKIRMEAQKISEAEAKLAEAKRREQQILAAEQALRAKTQEMALAEAKMASAEAKLAEVNKKQAQIQAVEKRLSQQVSEQNKKIAAYSRERISSQESVATVRTPRTPNALSPSARNIRSNQSVAKIPSKAPMKSVSPSFGKGNIQSVLNQSGLSSVSNVLQQTAGHYSWRAAGMVGKAEVKQKVGGENLSQFAQSYIAREKQKCRGDFASLPSTVPQGRHGYEIACVGPNGEKSASVVFAQKGNDLIAIIHETSADNMDAAIDARDRVAGKL